MASQSNGPVNDVPLSGCHPIQEPLSTLSTGLLPRFEEPERFDPDRFLPERSKGRSRWQYLPFGGGPRSCVGDHFAMLEATLALATVVRAAEIESLDENFPLATPFTVVAAAPIRARIGTNEITRR